ncbi:glycosyltransferase family 2 protein [Novosphingobium mangrovi (ex Huang et al. 2023)]|uniref:Glycosyltransferase family 2 protein n=1 Tax=Novosphingobium mangrovi (ex Huang et al. 2023) TaxID=2976432 RepID=A0ABT2I9J8_9SPHN|nr:glycosyltransferase family 2 protein [Novosphingobium mangrovi (ex Huang et al. 2023)]MCT2401506.1 glycosyltransferase family 2 protein [Novosphingobium mangrovi (ex Huang et al. 2023)]
MNAMVSIVLPYRNAGPFLEQAIASVQAQTYPDWELLLIDDRSSDGGPAIAARAAGHDPRVRTLEMPADGPHGAAAARNHGLRDARGAFVCFLDADDLFMPGKLEGQLALMQAHPEAGMVYGPTEWWYPGSPRRNWIEPLGRYAGRLHEPPALLADVILKLRSQVPCTCAVLIRTDLIRTFGGFEEAFHLYEDQTLWVKVMLHAPVFVSDRCTALYRQHDTSVSAKAFAEGVYDRMKPHSARDAFLDWVDGYVRAEGRLDAAIAGALRQSRASGNMAAAGLTLRDRLSMLSDRADRFAKGRANRLRRKLLGKQRRQ